MNFAQFRISSDLKNLKLPLDFYYKDLELNFYMKFNSQLYNKKYHFILTYPQEYPFKPPRLKIKQNIFHPNIYQNSVCLKVLRENWLCSYDLNSIVASLVEIFENLSSEEAFNTEAGSLLEYDKKEFIRRVKELENE